MKLFSFALSVLVALPLTAAMAKTAGMRDQALDEFEEYGAQMRHLQEAYENGTMLVPLKVQQYDTAAEEVDPMKNILDYKSAVTDRYYGYQMFILVNKSVSSAPGKSRNMQTMQPQTMYIFGREGDEIKIKAVLPVSTGKEPAPGRADTHEGFMRIQNAQKSYTSRKYGEAMPFSLWFESEYGTAIHQTLQSRCDSLIGHRASAGCIRLCPGDAERVFNIVTSKDLPRTSPIVLLDKRSGVPVARNSSVPLPKNKVSAEALYEMPKVVRGYPVLVRIIDGNTPAKAQELKDLLDNPTQNFQKYFKPVAPEAMQQALSI